ncbi:hypothetical protein OAD61_00385 [bacterium]|nr:hypothetical protein [bacterium]
MANLSPETQAIIDRLKTEGDLVRNSGTNSVRSVKFQLDKFESIFNVISSNIAEQTDMMRLQLGIQSEAVEKSNTREQLAELDPPSSDTTKKDKDDKVTPLKDVGNKTGDAIANALSMKNLVLGSAGMFVAFNLVKGFVDAETDGGFSRMQKNIGEISWDQVGSGFESMTAAITSINWTNFSSAINAMSDGVITFTTWLGDTGIGDIVSTVVAGGLISAGAKGAVMGALSKAGGGVGMAGRLAAIGPGIALVAAGLALYYGDDIANWLKEQTGADSPEMQNGIENLVTVGTVGLGAMSIGMMFGPAGIITVAAATAAVGLGVLIHGWIQKTKREQAEEFNADVDAALALANAEADPSNMSEDTTAAIAHAIAEARRRTRLAIGDSARTEAEAAQTQLENLLSIQETDASEGINALQMNRLREQILGGDENAIAELQKYAMDRAKDTEGSIMRWRPFGDNVSNEEFAADLIESFGGTAFSDRDLTTQQQIDQRNAWDAISDGIIEGIKTAAPPSIEASPTSSPSGNGQLTPYDEFGNPRFSTSQEQNSYLGKLYRGEIDLSMGGGITVINAPVIAPSPTTVTNGGSSVTQVSFGNGGGGNGGPSLLAYGLTGSIA